MAKKRLDSGGSSPPLPILSTVFKIVELIYLLGKPKNLFPCEEVLIQGHINEVALVSNLMKNKPNVLTAQIRSHLWLWLPGCTKWKTNRSGVNNSFYKPDWSIIHISLWLNYQMPNVGLKQLFNVSNCLVAVAHKHPGFIFIIEPYMV